MPASVPVNIFLWCWIKIIFIVGVLVEVKFANMFYDLKKIQKLQVSTKLVFMFCMEEIFLKFLRFVHLEYIFKPKRGLFSTERYFSWQKT